jgi:hypothetical protein
MSPFLFNKIPSRINNSMRKKVRCWVKFRVVGSYLFSKDCAQQASFAGISLPSRENEFSS